MSPKEKRKLELQDWNFQHPLYVILLVWGRLEATKQCFAALNKSTYPDLYILTHLQEETPESHDLLMGLGEEFEESAPRGCKRKFHMSSSAVNIGINKPLNLWLNFIEEMMDGTYYISHLGNDMLVEPDTFKYLVWTMECIKSREVMLTAPLWDGASYYPQQDPTKKNKWDLGNPQFRAVDMVTGCWAAKSELFKNWRFSEETQGNPWTIPNIAKDDVAISYRVYRELKKDIMIVEDTIITSVKVPPAYIANRG